MDPESGTLLDPGSTEFPVASSGASNYPLQVTINIGFYHFYSGYN